MIKEDRECLRCCGDGLVQLRMDTVDLVMLVLNRNILDFELLLPRDNNRSVDGFCINRTGKVCFITDEVPLCAAPKFDGADFYTDFER